MGSIGGENRGDGSDPESLNCEMGTHAPIWEHHLPPTHSRGQPDDPHEHRDPRATLPRRRLRPHRGARSRASSRASAATCCARDLACDPDDASTWTRAGGAARRATPTSRFAAPPTRRRLHAAFDALVGRGRWLPRPSLGTFPIRFPSDEEPGDAGWHADAGFYGDDGSMRLNLRSSGRALLMLFLFSDVGDDDAPTRIEVGSHLDVPRLLAPAGEAGLTYIEVAERFDPERDYPIALATGARGRRLSLPSLPGARGATASRHDAQVHGAAAAPSRAADRARARRRRLLAGRDARSASGSVWTALQ